MTYATITEYRATVNDADAVEGSNIDNPDALTIDSAHLDRALISASNKINAALGIRFSVPIFPSPPDLIRICIRIARFELEIYEMRAIVQAQYDAAIADLNAYRLGTAELIGVDNRFVPLKPVDPSQTNNTRTTIGQRTTGNEWNLYPPNLPIYPTRGMDYERYHQPNEKY